LRSTISGRVFLALVPSALTPKIIKIDRSFVSPTHESTYNDTLLEAIVSLGQKLNMTVLARGSKPKDSSSTSRLGCEVGQGYLFSPAVPAGEVAACSPEVASLGRTLALLTPVDLLRLGMGRQCLD